MLVGHLAVGLAAKRAEPRLSLGTAFLAALLADLILFPLLLGGVEIFRLDAQFQTNRAIGANIVYSHSLLMDGVWAGVFAAIYFLRRRSIRAAWVLFGAVLSHWLLDFASHRPDMPLAPGFSQVVGLGLWNSIPATLAVEGGVWLAAIAIYVRATQAKSRAGRYGFWTGIALLTLIWCGNITQSMDPNPVRAGISGLVLFSLMVVWAYWINAARSAWPTRTVVK